MDDLEAKFRAIEIDAELEQMKQELRRHGYEFHQSSTTSSSQNNANSPGNDKIVRCYSVFGLKPGASLKEVKQAHRNLIKKWHPDLFYNNL